MKGYIMKLVTAIIKPFKLDEAKEALEGINIYGLTASEAKGYGRQKGHTELYRGAEYPIDFLPKIRLEMAVADNQVELVIECLSAVLKTGKIGDGKIWTTPIDTMVRVRTGETGENAL